MRPPVLTSFEDLPAGPRETGPPGYPKRDTHPPNNHIHQWKNDDWTICPLFSRRTAANATALLLSHIHTIDPVRIKVEGPKSSITCGCSKTHWLGDTERDQG